jgi:imidazolonepropionase
MMRASHFFRIASSNRRSEDNLPPFSYLATVNLFIRNISQLATVAAHGRPALSGAAMRDIGIVADAGVLCRDGRIAWVGPMSEWHETLPDDVMELGGAGTVALPGFVDSHTHMLFAGSRDEEFALRAQGATYQQIAEQGGGILSTIRHVRTATKRELKRPTARTMMEMMKQGTTTVEIKSGYGLTVEAEIAMMEAINELKEEEVMDVVPTFLGAHAIPPEFTGNAAGYVDLIVNEMIPYIGRKKLATFCDVFCEKGYFGIEDSRRILEAGRRSGMALKVHAEELTPLGGAALAADVGATSADHLEHVTAEGIQALRKAGVVATVLPGVSFFLNHGYAPARAMIDAGVAVAIASDFNPGSCMSFSMPLMMTIACTQMRMTPEEAVTAVTLNGAAALGLSATHGSIEVGKTADIILARVPNIRFLAYHFGVNHVCTTIKRGTILEI